MALPSVDTDGTPFGGGGYISGGSGGSGTSGGGTMGLGDAAKWTGLGTAVAGPVGGVIGTVLGVWDSVAGLFKGKTAHLSYQQVLPVSNDFQNKMSKVFYDAYGSGGMTKISHSVPGYFAQTMEKFWGFSASLNSTILRDVNENHDLARQLGLFAMWVGTNIDMNRPETFGQFLRDLFPPIFLAATEAAGYDPMRIIQDVQVVVGTPGGGGGAVTLPGVPGTGTGTGSSATTAGFNVQSLLLIVVVGGIIYGLATKKG